MPHFRMIQGKTAVALASGQNAEAEILRYADQYRADGPVTIQRREASSVTGKWYWKRHMLLEQWPVDTAVE